MIIISKIPHVYYDLVYGDGSVYVFSSTTKLIRSSPVLTYTFRGAKLEHVRNIFHCQKQWDMNKQDIPRDMRLQIKYINENPLEKMASDFQKEIAKRTFFGDENKN